jgi:hypothetical protein
MVCFFANVLASRTTVNTRFKENSKGFILNKPIDKFKRQLLRMPAGTRFVDESTVEYYRGLGVVALEDLYVRELLSEILRCPFSWNVVALPHPMSLEELIDAIDAWHSYFDDGNLRALAAPDPRSADDFCRCLDVAPWLPSPQDECSKDYCICVSCGVPKMVGGRAGSGASSWFCERCFAVAWMTDGRIFWAFSDRIAARSSRKPSLGTRPVRYPRHFDSSKELDVGQ